MKKTDKFWYNRMKYLKLKDKKLLKVFSKIYLLKCRLINRSMHSGIPVNEYINEFISPHAFSGIYISKNAKIGKGCTIFHQVTIGSNMIEDSKNYGAPTIGNNVYIGAGAKIIGNVKVGNNVRIGANCVVVNDVPDNSTIVLQEPRIIIKSNKKEGK